jgi:hypothetical protein
MTAADTIRLDRLDAQMRRVWLRRQVLHLSAGLLAFVRWAVPIFLLCVLIDWLTYAPAWSRALMLFAIVGVSLQRAWRCGCRDLRPFDAVRTALHLESRHGDLKSLLVSAIQLRDQAGGPAASSALSRHTCEQAEQAAAHLSAKDAVPMSPLYRPTMLMSGCVGAMALFVILNGPFLAAGVTRIFTPWIDAEYPTNTQIVLDDSELIVREGDTAAITAKLEGVVPDSAVIFVRTGEGRARGIDLAVRDRVATYEIASASRDFTYRIKAGDDRTDWQRVRVVPAPRIDEVAVQVNYPDYLSREAELIDALTLTVPEGSTVHWTLTLDRPIAEATLVRDGVAPMPLTVADDGKTLAFTADIDASQGYRFDWVDREQGFAFTSPRYFLQVAADQPPRIELTQPVSNLFAMVGRPLTLATRVQDDHGLGSAAIAYRVNQRDEQTADLPVESLNQAGEQTLDWDYREALPNLQVGDSVSFALAAADRYPQGPHAVRSETRRITFLSKEQYLEQIEKQRDRLLSRVQSIYRQQRSAHTMVRSLDPASQGYLQACQLEAIRQEMLRDQLKDISDQMQLLLNDLAANGVADAPQGEALADVRSELIAIADTHIATAANRLRDQTDEQLSPAEASPAEAAASVNTAARSLAGIVLLSGIDAAQEVFARETRMLAQLQAELRYETLTPSSATQRTMLVKHQNELADWAEALTDRLQAGIRYERRPLAVLRLIRGIKDLREAGTIDDMRQAAVRIDESAEGDIASAATKQAMATRRLLDAEFGIRLSGAYTTLLQTRDLVESMAAVQSRLSNETANLSADDFTKKREEIAGVQTTLRKQLLTLLLPKVPAPRATLFQDTPSVPPRIDAMVAEAGDAMSATLDALRNDRREDAAAAQQRSADLLAELSVQVDRWSVEMGLQSQGLSTLVAATSERLSRLEDFEVRVIALLEKTDIAVSEDEPVTGLAETQLDLAAELRGLIDGLQQDNEAEPDPDLPPLLTRLAEAERSLNTAAQSLEDNDADAAIESQEAAADSLAEAFALVVAQNERLTLLQDLLMFQRAVGFASGAMADIVAEQRDLLEATEAAEPEAMVALLPRFAHLRTCMADVAPLLDLVAARLDVGTPLAFAQTDFEDAMSAVEVGDQFDAVDAQDVAAESLETVRGLVAEIRSQTGYLAEIVAYLHESVSTGAQLADRQDALRREIAAIVADDVPGNNVERFAEAQASLAKQAATHGQTLVRATGIDAFAEPAEVMTAVAELLQDGDGAAAVEEMELASALYMENAERLLAVMTMLHGLPETEIMPDTEPALVRLVDVLAVASRHKAVYRETNAAGDELGALAKRQQTLSDRLTELAATGDEHPMLVAAKTFVASAVQGFASGDRAALRTSQRLGDTALRHFIIDQALELETAKPPPSASDPDPAADGEGSDEEADVTAGFIADFVSGESPNDKRSEWQVLAERNRAALNQNFARELPLEYRGLLKDYYEKVAR